MAKRTAADMIHSDSELSRKMEPATPSPEAGPSHTELVENSHSENGASPVYDGNMKSPERQNVNAIREALETQVEMEVGKPIAQKQKEVAVAEQVQDKALANGGATEVSAKPGTQIIINVASKKTAKQYVRTDGKPFEKNVDCIELSPDGVVSVVMNDGARESNRSLDDSMLEEMIRRKYVVERKRSAEGIGGEDQGKITSGHGGGMFGGTDLEGPTFHVGFTFRGSKREAKFSTREEADKFVRTASVKFAGSANGWAIKTSGVDFIIDPAKRALILELLKQAPKTTKEIEWALGGNVHSNIAYPIMQQLAKDGVVSHKQMRWSLKTGAVNPHTGDPARPETFDHKQQVPTKSMPQKGTPAAAELKIAIQTLKMPEAMQGVMGGPDAAHAHEVLARYGLRWDDADYMAGGKGVKKAATAPEPYTHHQVSPTRWQVNQGNKFIGIRDSEQGAIDSVNKYNQEEADYLKQAGEGMAKTEEALEKEAGFNLFFPGQVLQEFYPEIQHEIVDYPNASNSPMGMSTPEIVGDGGHELEGVLDEALDTNLVEAIQLPADIGEMESMSMMGADYSSTSPAGGMGIGRDGKPEVLEGVPLRKENDIRGPMFTDEFYGQYQGVPGAALAVASKTAAEGDEVSQFEKFLKLVCGEICATMIAAFKVTQRSLLDKVPGVGEIQLDVIEQGFQSSPTGSTAQGGRVKYLLGQLNDGDVKEAINKAWAQAAVWNDSPEGGFVYEVFVRPETIDTESLTMKYRFVCGTRE